MQDSDYEPVWKQILTMPIRVIGTILTWLGNASEGFERLFQLATSRATDLGDAAAKADSTFGRLTLIMLAPVFWLWNSLILPLGLLIFKNPFLHKILILLAWVLYPLVSVASFCRTLIQTRSRDVFFWSIPFVVVIGGILFALWLLNLDGVTVTQKYRRAIDEAIAKGEFQQAALYQQKLQSLGIVTDQSEIQRIRELVKSGNLAQAIEMAERITPQDSPGSPDIHFWLAGVYFDEQGPLKGEEAIDRAIYHLSQLEKSLANLNIGDEAYPPNVIMLKAMLEFRKSRIESGLDLLKSVSARYWPALVLQMETHIKLKQDEDAMLDAVALSQAAKRDPQLLNEVSTQFFAMWCAALERAGEREELKNAAFNWHQRYPDSPQGTTLWSGFQLQEIDALLVRGNDTDLGRACKLFIDVTNKLGSKSQPAISSWLMFRLPPQGANRNYLQLADLAAKSADVSSTLLEILGTAATVRGEHKKALKLLKQATDKDPENFIAWNNLAYVANSYFDDELDLALTAVEKAAQMQPKNIDILHTRGIIRVKLKQWDLAIEDLRAVVAQRPNDGEVHLGLAQAYDAVGKSELAAFHKQLAK